MTKPVRWYALRARYFNWMKRNTFKPLDSIRTFKILQANVFRSASYTFQPVFESIFGPIDAKYLVPSVQEACEQIRKESVRIAENQRIPDLQPRLITLSVNRTNAMLGLTGLRVLSATVTDIYNQLPTQTSSGSPDFVTPKGSQFERCWVHIQQVMAGVVTLPHVRDFWPVTVAWRTQMRESGVKFRPINVFPQVVSIMEAMFAVPFFKHFENNRDTSYSFAHTWQDNSKMWSKLQNYNNSLELDFKTFDVTVSNNLLHLFYQNLSDMIIFAENQKPIFDFIVDYHLHATVLTSIEGKEYFLDNKISGVLSGSVFTNFADSWINLFIINYIMSELEQSESSYTVRVMGDDAIIGTDLDGEKLRKVFIERVETIFHMSLNVGKTIVNMPGEPIHYMGFDLSDASKVMDVELMKRKMTITSRFIPEEILENKMVVWSKFCSICSTCSNGYSLWLEYKDTVLQRLGMLNPGYFHDLDQTELKQFDPTRRIMDAEQYVKDAWRVT